MSLDFTSREAVVERAENFDFQVLGADESAYDLFSAFRRHCPVVWSKAMGGFWLFTRRAEALEVLRDTEHFSNHGLGFVSDLDKDGPAIPIHADPPEHGMYRQDLNPMFSAANVVSKEDEMRERARDFLSDIARSGGGDLFEQFCVPYPVITFLLMLGAPVDDASRLLRWKNHLAHTPLHDRAAVEYAANVVGPEAGRYFAGLLEERERDPNPPDDLLTGLTRAKFGDRKFTSNEQVRIAKLFMMAGLDTVTAQLSLSFLFLAEHPSYRTALLSDPSLIPGAIEELLRLFGIVGTTRRCIKDVDIGGVRVRAGEMVRTPLASANHDELEFQDPDQVDFGRPSVSRHLAFGGGLHRCLGSHLARLELRVAFEELLAVIPDFRLVDGFAPKWNWNGIIGIDRLDIEVCRSPEERDR